MNHKKFRNTIKALLILVTLLSAHLYAQAGLNGRCIKFDDPNTATLVGEDGLILVTTNRGAEWVYENSGITNVLNGYSHFNRINLIAGENGIIVRSSNSGNTWYWVTTGTYENLNDVELLSNGRAIACGNSGKILISTNSGKSWSLSNFSETRNLTDLKFISNEVGFICGDSGALLKTTDSGNNWQVISVDPANCRLNAIEVIDEKVLASVGDSGKVFLTDDGGLSWNLTVLPDAGKNLYDIKFLNANTGIISGDDNLIYKTTDGGLSWNAAFVSNSNINDDFFSIAFADEYFGIIIASSSGIGVFTTDGGSIWSELDFEIIETTDKLNKTNDNSVVLNQNFPNPFNPATKISYNIPYDANVSIKIYDITGREVATLVTENQQAGIYTVDFNASGLSSGVYFYNMIADNGFEKINKVMKMILSK